MSTSGVPLELHRLIRQYVHSVEQLEILCALIEDASKSWQEADMYHRIMSSGESVSRNLKYFAAEGFVAGDPATGYRFSPRDSDKGRFAADLLKAYRERRVSVIEAIYKAPVDPVQQFADAFKLRKDKP